MVQERHRQSDSATKAVRDIRRATRRRFSAEDKIRIVLEGLRGEGSIAELCRKEAINQNLYYRWSKEFLEAGKKRLAGDTAREATSDEVKGLRRVREAVLMVMTARGAIEAWIVDDTGFPKRGRHSVGVARQYGGQLGKQDNCRVAVSLSVAAAEASLPVAWRLYLPEGWTEDVARRARAGVPEDVVFRTKPRVALEQIETALGEGVAPGTVLADAGYGNDSAFRDGITALGLDYVAGVLGNAMVWPPGTTPTVPAWRGRGRRPKRLRRGGDGAPVEQVRVLAENLPPEAWRAVIWRQGVAEPLASRFAALRVRPAHGDARRSEPRPEQWLLVEWPQDEPKPIKFWFSSLPVDTPIERLVYLAKLRWLIERDYLELKQELGLGHYEWRGWRGFHHHAALCVAAYGFLLAERAAIPPRDLDPPGWSKRLSFPTVTDPAAPPFRPERHIPHSIATLRRRIAHALAQTLQRCPCFTQTISHRQNHAGIL